jgi:quercetin dioxygenase-like cupin family protein
MAAMPSYTLVTNLRLELDIPEKGFVSRPIHNDDQAKIILFSFAAGAELAAHSAPMPVTIQILEGDAEMHVLDDQHGASAGFFVWLPPGVIHSIRATSNLRFMLTLWKKGV